MSASVSSFATLMPRRRQDATDRNGAPVGTTALDAPETYGDTARLADRHGRLVRMFEEAERASDEERRLGQRDRDYLDGAQWTPEEMKVLQRRGQAATVTNYIRRKVDLLRGLERKARTDPKAFPRTPSEDDRADAATQALRYVAADNDFHVVRSEVHENMLVEGFGGIEMGLVDDGQGGADVTITHVPWDRLWYDPHARAGDFGDARYLGMVLWMDRDQLEDMYPDRPEVIGDSFLASGQVGNFYDDKPGNVAWTDSTRQRVRVVQCYWQERGTWWGGTFTRSGFLADPQQSRFLDKRGKSACPLLLQSAYVDRENRRYGIVRDLITLQDEINKRKSKALHLLSVNQAIADEGAVKDWDVARRELARPDGLVIVNPQMRFEIQRGAQLAQGQFELLQHAVQEMQLSGPNASMSGTDQRELSGRAILAQQAGGAVQNEPIADSLRMFSRRVYEMAWMAVRMSWTAGKWVRVVDDLGATRWLGVNLPVRLMDQLAQMPEAQRAQVMQQMQIAPNDPRLQQVVGVANDITDLEVDISIEEGMDIPSLQAEQFQTLVQLAGIQPGLIPGDVLIAASGLRNKDMLLERMKEHQDQQAQAQAKQQPLIEAHAQADLQQKQAKAAADMALAKERQHAVVASIADVHEQHQNMLAPPDPPSAPGTVAGSGARGVNMMPPELQALHDHADLRGKHAKAAVDEARANDLAHAAVQRVADVHQMHHAMQHPPPAPTSGQ